MGFHYQNKSNLGATSGTRFSLSHWNALLNPDLNICASPYLPRNLVPLFLRIYASVCLEIIICEVGITLLLSNFLNLPVIHSRVLKLALTYFNLVFFYCFCCCLASAFLLLSSSSSSSLSLLILFFSHILHPNYSPNLSPSPPLSPRSTSLCIPTETSRPPPPGTSIKHGIMCYYNTRQILSYQDWMR